MYLRAYIVDVLACIHSSVIVESFVSLFSFMMALRTAVPAVFFFEREVVGSCCMYYY